MFFLSRDNNDDSFWISYADLMTCLMIIFVFIAYIFIINYKAVETTEKSDKEIVFQALLAQGINMDENGNIFISDDSKEYVSFQQGKSVLNEKDQKLLDGFIPKLIYGIYYNEEAKKIVKEIRIEGYSSTEWKKNSTAEEKYIKNMELSQQRTMTVVNSFFNNKILQKNFQQDKEMLKWVLQHLTANGFSSSNIVKDEKGKEDRKKSRRVTFSILYKKPEQILK